MAKIFLDANAFIDLVEQRKPSTIDSFQDHFLFISPLSLHILIYVYKYTIPQEKLADFAAYFTFTALDGDIAGRSLIGPTNDFEDNIQLHSAAQAECDYFLTDDKKLLALTFYGKMKIVKTL